MRNSITGDIRKYFRDIYNTSIYEGTFDGLSAAGNAGDSDILIINLEANMFRIMNIRVWIPGCHNFEFTLNSKATSDLGLHSIVKYIDVDEFVVDDSLNQYGMNRDNPETKNVYLHVKNWSTLPTNQIKVQIVYLNLADK